MSIGNLILGADSVTVSYLTHLICYDNLLQNTTCTNTKCDRSLLQNTSGCLLQNLTALSQNAIASLQIATTLSQKVTDDVYYKLRQYIQTMNIFLKPSRIFHLE